MSTSIDANPTLEQDATLDAPLRKVAYEAGMLLGLEATREEQTYHRRRLTRHQYWLHGAGTLAGMAVSLKPRAPATSEPTKTSLIVGPGLGVDGLGREVLIHEPYCIDLGTWLKAQSETRLREGYDETANLLWLKVTVRYAECEVAAQPVLARKLNLSTDAVQPSRVADGIQLELIPELPPAEETRYQPWSAHAPLPQTPLGGARPAALTATETGYLDAGSDETGRQRELQARLLHAFGDGVGVKLLVDELEAGARLLLARLSIALPTLDGILAATENDEVVNPNAISLNNLVRPFLITASQLAYLQRSAV
ncbi:MAG TPA: hypothetical protein VNR18_06965 [Hyphomicrobiales bacterium]|nr:hypothetical protein [Hyphomicrobiales bacterium]